MYTIVDFSVVVTPVAHVTVRMSSTVGVATINGALWDQGSFQSIDGSIWVFGCSLAGALGVPLNAANPGVWSGLALSMTRPCPSPYCFQSILASISAGIENDLVQGGVSCPSVHEVFCLSGLCGFLTPKATFGSKLKVLGGPKVCVHKPHELSVSQRKVCEEEKEEGKGKEMGKEKNGSFCIFVQTLCGKHEVLRVEAEILGNELLTVLSQKYGVDVERFYCTFQGERLEESLQLRHMGIQRDSRLVILGLPTLQQRRVLANEEDVLPVW